MDMVLLRHYFRSRQPRTGKDVLRDAAVLHEPGAKQLVLFALQLRSNTRSRRSYAQVVAQARSRRHANWYERLAKTLMGLFQVCRKQCVPIAPVVGQAPQGLSRRHRRSLSGHGLAKPSHVTVVVHRHTSVVLGTARAWFPSPPVDRVTLVCPVLGGIP